MRATTRSHFGWTPATRTVKKAEDILTKAAAGRNPEELPQTIAEQCCTECSPRTPASFALRTVGSLMIFPYETSFHALNDLQNSRLPPKSCFFGEDNTLKIKVDKDMTKICVVPLCSSATECNRHVFHRAGQAWPHQQPGGSECGKLGEVNRFARRTFYDNLFLPARMLSSFGEKTCVLLSRMVKPEPKIAKMWSFRLKSAME